MNQNPEPELSLMLYVYNRGYQCAALEFIGPSPPWPYTLNYRRGTTARHGNKRVECWRRPSRGDAPLELQAECRPSQLREWLDFILPQNGFKPTEKAEQLLATIKYFS